MPEGNCLVLNVKPFFFERRKQALEALINFCWVCGDSIFGQSNCLQNVTGSMRCEESLPRAQVNVEGVDRSPPLLRQFDGIPKCFLPHRCLSLPRHYFCDASSTNGTSEC